MARMRSGQRGTTRYRYASPSVLSRSNEPDFVSSWSFPVEAYNPLLEVEDNRTWNPDRRPKTVTGNRVWSSVPLVRVPHYRVHKRSWIARDYYTNIPVGVQLPYGVQRVGMFPVISCVRRKVRRMVMFATGQTGKGARQKRRRRNESSGYRC